MIDGIRDRRRPAAAPSQSPKTNTFSPPDSVAAVDEVTPPGTPSPTVQPLTIGGGGKAAKRSLKERLAALSTKQKLLYGGLAVAVLAGGGFGAYQLFFSKAAPLAKVINKTPSAPTPPPVTTVASTLSGLQVEPSVNGRQVIAVMIENSLDARPQSGLNQADVVFEAIAEGGITRLVALFQDNEPTYVGPVRSARPYFVQWAMGFDAALAHAGGSPQALADIKDWGTKDLNHNTTAFWRVDNRTAPHNLYTSIAKLREYAGQRGYNKSSFTPFARKAEQASATPAAKTINLNISSANFAVHYDYDQPSNSYKRSEGGATHIDEKSSSQLAPKVVVVLIVPQGISGQYTTYAAVGSGQAYVFQDGGVQTVTWQKSSTESSLTLSDSSKDPVKLNAGQTWITALGSTDRLTYAP